MRPFGAAQVEITSRCATGCLFCPHDALSDAWVEGDMRAETYREYIVPHLELFDLVYLQGWGEPMLHPRLWEMLDISQKKGCRTGFTTNGARLEGEQNEKLLDMGVDLLSISFAGAAATIHESLRTHSDYDLLCANFESLANLRARRGCKKPWLELHFLMTRANLAELPAVVELAASLGADEVAATNLTYSPSLALDRSHVFGKEPLPEHLEIIARARQTAERLKIPLRIYPLQTEPDTLVCDADPIHTVYINHCGEVCPCVYLGLSVRGSIPRYFQGEAHPFEPVSFGNVRDGFLQALYGETRQHFLEPFNRRNASRGALAALAYLTGEHTGELPALPASCQFCYKMLGI
ncbi:MAG: radical SAM/SPASM domain-containing protein [Bacteroidota bacterium]